jgi:hypothetical protein
VSQGFVQASCIFALPRNGAWIRDGNPAACVFFVTDPDGDRIEVLPRGGRHLQAGE